LIVKEEETIKIVDDLAYKVIGTRTVKVIEKNETMHALETVRYVLKARYNLITIGVLDKEGCQIQMLKSPRGGWIGD